VHYDAQHDELMRQRLQACPERFRGWEWRWLNASADHSSQVLNGGALYPRSVAFSPDGTRIVAALVDGRAAVWDAMTNACLLLLKVADDMCIRSAAFSPDGKRIVTASDDGTARVWDAVTGELFVTLVGHTDQVYSAAYSPDGRRIVTTSLDCTPRVWDAVTGELLVQLTGPRVWVSFAEFSPDGKRIVTASNDNTARVWNAATGSLLVELKGHTGWIYPARFSPDGTRIVTASIDRTARIWNSSTGQCVVEFKNHEGEVHSACFSTDGTYVLTASSDRSARVWNALTGKPFATLERYTDEVSSASFSPDGTLIMLIIKDGTLYLCDAISGLPCLECKGVAVAAFSPDGKRIVAAMNNGTTRVLDATDRTVLRAQQNCIVLNEAGNAAIRCLAFSPDGRRIVTASSDDTARVWDAATGEALIELKGHISDVTSAAFSPDGQRIVTASWDDTARVWDAATGEALIELKGHASGVTSAAFSPDGQRIVTAALDGTMKVWETTPFAQRRTSILAAQRVRRDAERVFASRLGWSRVTGGGLPEVWWSFLDDAIDDSYQRALWVGAARAEYLKLWEAAEASNNQAWWSCEGADCDDPSAAAAVVSAGEALALVPDDPNYLNTQGVAWYRLGFYEEAIATLLRSDLGYESGDLVNWAFITMSHQRLGRVDAARESLAYLEELVAEALDYEGNEPSVEDLEYLEGLMKYVEEARRLVGLRQPGETAPS